MSSYDLYKRIVRDVQELEPVSAIRQGIDCLRGPIRPETGSGTVYSGIEPKNVMLVIRWLYQHHRRGRGVRTLSVNDLKGLSRDISILESLTEDEKIPVMGPHDWPRIDYHRRPHEDSLHETGSSIPRQLILFNDKLEGSRLSEQFTEKYQMPMSMFILIYTWCCAHLETQKKRTLSVQKMRSSWGEGNADKFLNAVARDFESASDWVKEYSNQTMVRGNPQRTIWRQLREPTPLVRIPFFRDGDTLRPYSLAVLETGLRGNLYEMLKAMNVGFPGGCFGKAYEEYIQDLIKKLNLGFLSERQLRKELRAGSRRADCLALDGRAVIIIEVKSTTPSPKEMGEQDFVGAGAKIVEGISQIAHTAGQLPNVSRQDIFGVVVTYGKYEHTWETIGQKAHARAQDELGRLGNPILTNQCFFLDVDDFEHLVDEALGHDTGFGDTLRKLAVRQKDQKTGFDFKRELERAVGRAISTPGWLVTRRNQWFAWMEKNARRPT